MGDYAKLVIGLDAQDVILFLSLVFFFAPESESTFPGRRIFVCFPARVSFCLLAGERLRFQSGHLEFWDHGHRARHGRRALSQVPADEGEASEWAAARPGST